MKRIYIIEEAPYYKDGAMAQEASPTKKLAEEKCRKEGYKFNKREELFLNEELGRYRRIVEIPVIQKEVNENI